MSWYAIEAIDEAVEDTRELLLPFDSGTWLRLALLVVFTGGGIGFVNPVSFAPSSFDVEQDYDPGTDYNPETGAAFSTNDSMQNQTGMASESTSLSNALIVLILLAIAGLVTLGFYISSVFEFIYYQSLLDRDVSIRSNFRKHWMNGLRYIVFELVYLVFVASVVISLVLIFMASPLFGFFSLFVAIPVLLLLAVFAGLVHDFVLPSMIKEKKGLITSFSRIWPDIREQWREVVVYLVVKIGIGIAIGIGVATLSGVLLIPFLVVFGILAVLFAMISETLIVIPVLLGLLLFIVVLIGVSVVTKTFIYSFILVVHKKLF